MARRSAIERVFDVLGSQHALAEKLKVSDEAVRKWKRRVPAERVLEIEEATGGAITRHELRPDIYPAN
jgi:DNA-binding transcriptional regulator YdaS (Cro superfamily)